MLIIIAGSVYETCIRTIYKVDVYPIMLARISMTIRKKLTISSVLECPSISDLNSRRDNER